MLVPLSRSLLVFLFGVGGLTAMFVAPRGDICQGVWEVAGGGGFYAFCYIDGCNHTCEEEENASTDPTAHFCDCPGGTGVMCPATWHEWDNGKLSSHSCFNNACNNPEGCTKVIPGGTSMYLCYCWPENP